MSAAPAFESTLNGGAAERSLIALLGAVTGGALGAWLWSHVDARIVLGGHAALAWLVVVASAGVSGWIGWFIAVPRPCTLRWQQDRWTWIDAQSNIECAGTVEPRLDLGNWMLLALRSPDGALRWATVGRRRAGAAWHPLRATLFAPARRRIEPRAGESAPR
ncbi:MAG TPA: hypothetical protein VF107_03580 [Burkholderiaceae bacterium]